MKKIKIVSKSSNFVKWSTDFAASCKKSDKQVIKRRSSTFFSEKIDFAE
jgi:hypothetical protein